MVVTIDRPSEDLTLPHSSEPRISLPGVTWEQYETLIVTMGDRPRLRMSYLDGNLEIMTVSSEHEMIKKMIARLLEIYALEADIELYSYGSATFRERSASKGLEADESYCLDDRKDVPDFAIEVVLSSGVIDKLAIYQGLGVLEVWVWKAQRLTVQRLRKDASGYDEFTSSALLPKLDFKLLADHILPDNEPQAVRAFRNLIRSQLEH